MKSPYPQSHLIARLCHALDIADLAVEQLAAKGYSSPDNTLHIRPEKVISETAVLLVAVSTADYIPEVARRIKHLAESLIPHARSKRMMLGLCMEPSVAWDYALPHACLTRLGYPDSQFDALLRQSLDAQASSGRERVPHRVLEQHWAAKNLDALHDLRLPAIRASILNHPMDLLKGSREDVYAYTHALMYATDFGLQPMPLPRDHSIILAEAESMLARCLDEQDYDLGGEVLLSWPLTGTSWSGPAAFAFRVLAHVEDQAGFLPTANTRVAELESLQGISRKRYVVATAYHTAYVMGLICAASLRPGHAPPDNFTTDGARPGAAEQILALLDVDGQTPHWRDVLRQLTAAEGDSLAGFLIEVALRRRAASNDVAGLRTVLGLAFDLGLADRPAAVQAAEMLIRLAALSTTLRLKKSADLSGACRILGEREGALLAHLPGGAQKCSQGSPAQ